LRKRDYFFIFIFGQNEPTSMFAVVPHSLCHGLLLCLVEFLKC
jgi:hypothetical protein